MSLKGKDLPLNSFGSNHVYLCVWLRAARVHIALCVYVCTERDRVGSFQKDSDPNPSHWN